MGKTLFCHWALLRKVKLHLLYSLHQCILYIYEIPLSLSFSKESPSSFSLYSYERLQTLNRFYGLLLDLLWNAHVVYALRSPELHPALQLCLTRAEKRGRFTSLDLLVAVGLLSSTGTLLAHSHCCSLACSGFFCRAAF